VNTTPRWRRKRDLEKEQGGLVLEVEADKIKDPTMRGRGRP